MDDEIRFEQEWEKFTDMLDDWNLTPEDYYKTFSDMCINYDNTSCVPYSICNVLIDDEFLCEEYYMQMLMDVYSYYNIGEDFLDLLQRLIDDGYCAEYQKKTHELIKDNIQDGFVIAYRGEYSTDTHNNLDYKQSVSYSLDYEQAKFFCYKI